jgi:DNA primase
LANYIPEDKISEIRNTADIVGVISEIVLLKKTGKNYVGLCPFHSEKTASFTVSPEKQIFYCFGCGAGGNIFSFLMKHEGVTFPEAARMLARRYGIEIPVQNLKPGQKKLLSEKEDLLKINKEAMVFFHAALCEKPEGKKAMAYLQKRGITQETVNRFRVGYAPARWDNMVRFFTQKRVPLSLVEKAGLILPRKNKDGFYDRFRDRIIFPIYDLNQQVIGFGGRVMDDALPKYLNSPDTPVFNKSRALYGIHLAKSDCRQKGMVYVVEGYFDLLALHQHGIQNSVATLGTAFTAEHLRAIKGYAGRVNLVFDSDEAGIKSAERSIGMFIEGSIDARIVVLPPGYDPDAYLFEFGVEKFLHSADDALGVMSFLVNSAIKKHGLSIEGKTRIVADLTARLSTIDDPVARSLCVKEVSERINIGEGTILEKLRDVTSRTRKNLAHGSGSLHAGGIQKQRAGKISGTDMGLENGHRLERQIIAMMIHFPEILPEIEQRHLLDGFGSNRLKAIGRMILEKCNDKTTPVSEILSGINDTEQREMVAQLAIQEDVWGREGCLRLISQFELSRDRRENRLLEKIKAAEKADDHDLLLELLRQKQELLRKWQLT